MEFGELDPSDAMHSRHLLRPIFVFSVHSFPFMDPSGRMHAGLYGFLSVGFPFFKSDYKRENGISQTRNSHFPEGQLIPG